MSLEQKTLAVFIGVFWLYLVAFLIERKKSEELWIPILGFWVFYVYMIWAFWRGL